jgi:hypothetical protein
VFDWLPAFPFAIRIRGTAHIETARTEPYERKTARVASYTRNISESLNQELHNYYRTFSSLMLFLTSKQV